MQVLVFLRKFLLFFLAFSLLLQVIAAKEVTVIYNFPLDSGIADIKENISLPDDKNAYSAFVEVADSKPLALDISYYDFDGDGVKESAFINSVQGIATSSDYTKYWQFSVNNRPALVGISAFVPNNNDVISLDYLDGPITDALEWLVDNQKGNGSIGANIFQDAFALMALSLAYDNNASIDSTVISKTMNYLLSQQDLDAGFGDDLYTATAIMALLSNGKDLNDFAVSGKTSIGLLKEHQSSDGGFKSGTNESDVDTTSWVTIAFAQANQQLPTKNGNSPTDFLLSAQHANGSFGYNAADATESIDFSEEAIIALSAASHSKDQNVAKALDWLSSKQNSDGCINDGFRTALGGIAFGMFEESEKSENAANCLKALQNADGSFGRASNNSNAIDTGIAVIALAKEKFPLTVSAGNETEGTLGLNAIVKFLVEIKNNGNVKAENVNISISGIPADWIYTSSQGSISHFDEIKAGETKTAEIFAKLESTGTYTATAVVTADQSNSAINSNDVSINVQEALLSVSLRIA